MASDLEFRVPSCSVARRSPAASCDRISELAQDLALLLEDAVDAGSRKSRGLEFVGRARGFTDTDRYRSPGPTQGIPSPGLEV
jgi:hypothetical protein